MSNYLTKQNTSANRIQEMLEKRNDLKDKLEQKAEKYREMKLRK